MKHERATLIVFAYIIGFTTAYIAYALTPSAPAPTYTAVPQPTAPAVVTTPNRVAGVSAREATPRQYQSVEAEMTGEGLFAILDGQSRILSAQAIRATGQAGFHDEVIAYAPSPDNQFIAYCVRQTGMSASCNPYVYDVAADVVRKAKLINSSAELIVPTTQAEVSWQGGLLTVGDYIADGVDTPWQLRTSN